jgi:hypothetical protein
MINLTVSDKDFNFGFETPSTIAAASYITNILSSICELKLNAKFEHRIIDNRGMYYQYSVSTDTRWNIFQITIYYSDKSIPEGKSWLMVSGEYAYPDGDKTSIRQMLGDLTNNEAVVNNLLPLAKCCR